jgi:hypothetical protein
VFGPLLRSEAAAFAADPKVQAVAREAVLAAAGKVVYSNDERFEYALKHASATLKEYGKAHALGWAALAIEAAFRALKDQGAVE